MLCIYHAPFCNLLLYTDLLFDLFMNLSQVLYDFICELDNSSFNLSNGYTSQFWPYNPLWIMSGIFAHNKGSTDGLLSGSYSSKTYTQNIFTLYL